MQSRKGILEYRRWVEAFLDLSTPAVIAYCRLALALGGLMAAYLDPTQPRRDLAYVSLAAYAVFSLALAVTFRYVRRDYVRITLHGVEIVLISLVAVFTDGLTSPYFVYFTFVLLVGTVSWQWHGALGTGAVLSLVMIMLTISQLVTEAEHVDIDALLVRNIYLLVASALFGLLGHQLARSQMRLERLRLAQQVHDGILQALTAARTKIHAIAPTCSDSERDRLLEIARLLQTEQQHLRKLVEETWNEGPLNKGAREPFRTAQLRTIVSHLERLWDCELILSVSPVEFNVSSHLGAELNFFLTESVANAVVHGKASRITISIREQNGSILLKITDNGTGLSYPAGLYDHDHLAEANIGPRSLRQRIDATGGRLRLSTSADGLELQIRLPIGGHDRNSR